MAFYTILKERSASRFVIESYDDFLETTIQTLVDQLAPLDLDGVPLKMGRVSIWYALLEPEL